MNFKNLLIIFFLIFLTNCDQYTSNKKIIDLDITSKYKNSGFALIYKDILKDNKLVSKKIDSRSLLIFHKSLKKNSFVKITNPKNQKTIIAEVKSNKVKFSDFYNCVITSRIAEELLLDQNDPYIDLVLISQNSSFIAKKAKTFNEEKNVAEKAPVDDIKIDNLVVADVKKKMVINKKKSKYSIKIADFYYEESAKDMINRIVNETNIKKPFIQKISNTKYRVLLGPFDDIKKIEDMFNKIKLLEFENLEILKNV